MTKTYQYIQPYTQSYYLSNDLVRQQETNKVALGDILHLVLQTSNLHDKALRQQFSTKAYMIQPHQTWIITNNKIEIFEWPQINQTIDIQTKIVDANRFFVIRAFEVCHQGQLMMQIYTQFAAIDFETRKITRLNVSDIESVLGKTNPIVFNKFKIEANRVVDDKQQFEIQSADIDENQHVNYLVYFRWAYDAITPVFKQTHLLNKIEMKYATELLPEHTVSVKTYFLENSVVQSDQVIYNETLDKEACHIRMTWTKV
ncbi:hypothetical protein IU403_02585 [Aerococcaceae bacterium zg-BR22]|uniref:acyl-[acyl-carrier-protein] thioesterase n=1 Tax=Aerococcaceae bacterium zg-1292 TaxID=2774330 RepID=UPI0040649B26|nr:hypothetical protein [Aerococcaceae bacterium zg-BR22]